MGVLPITPFTAFVLNLMMDLNHRLAYSPRLYPHTLPPELMRSHIKERYRVLLTASSLRLSCVHRGMRVKHMPHFRLLYRSSLSYPTHIGFEPMTQVFNLLRLSYGLSNWPLYQCEWLLCRLRRNWTATNLIRLCIPTHQHKPINKSPLPLHALHRTKPPPP